MRELPEGYQPSEDELACGMLWQLAAQLNAQARAARARGVSVSFTLGRQVGEPGVPPSLHVDTQLTKRVMPIWYVDGDGEPVPVTNKAFEQP
jgi:hypothetical protein